jgi:hypothetical protein
MNNYKSELIENSNLLFTKLKNKISQTLRLNRNFLKNNLIYFVKSVLMYIY